MSGRARAEPQQAEPIDPGGPYSTLNEYRCGSALWITTPEFEASGRALGLPDPGVVEDLLAIGPEPSWGSAGRAPTRIEEWPNCPQRVHVRRVLHGGWLAPLWRKRIAGLARLRSELRLTAGLYRAGAPVPAPVFAVARRDGLLWRAALCTTHIEGALDALTFLRTGPPSRALEAAALAAGRAVRRLHDLGVRHADLHLGNLLVREEDDGFRAWVIDFDRARAGRSLDRRRRERELQRLARSVHKRNFGRTLTREGSRAFHAGYEPAQA